LKTHSFGCLRFVVDIQFDSWFLVVMPTHPTVFSQLTALLYQPEFRRCADLFPMPRCSRSFSAYDHFLALCFGQLTYRESLRDIVACLQARPQLQYHLGFRGRITRTNFAYANAKRDWRAFAAVAEVLIRRARQLYQHDAVDPDFPAVAAALDSSIIHLSLKLFPWAYWGRSQAGALKLHTLLAFQGNLPVWSAITEASLPDVKMLDQVPVEPGAYYVMDRAYLDFSRLLKLQMAGAKFVVRNKRHVRFRVLQSRKVDRPAGLRCDQTIRLSSEDSKDRYPLALRRIRFREPRENRSLVFLSNDFELPASTICELYKRRWQVELFFKWIKQHLRIRHFFGRSRNAIYCQVWTALCAYLLVAIAKRQLHTPKSLYEILQIVSVSALEQIPLGELLTTTALSENSPTLQNTPFLLGF
jgi:IS4 transposase